MPPATLRALRRSARKATIRTGLAELGRNLRNPRMVEAWLHLRSRPVAAEPEGGEARLESLLRHAVRRVPFYRRRVGSSAPRLQEFPILGKRDVREHFAELIDSRPELPALESPGLFQWLGLAETSGSTGFPIRRLIGFGDRLHHWSFLRRLHHDLDVPRRGDIISVHLQPAGKPVVELHTVPALHRYWNLNKLTANPTRVGEYLGVLALTRPILIAGAPSRVADLARLCEAYGIEKRPVAALYTHEMALGEDRAVIERAFACPLVSVYATSETGLLGWSCRRGRLHIEPDVARIEVVRDDGTAASPGEIGRLLVTDLSNTLMPFIRYEIGDLAVAAESAACDCGRRAPHVERLVGRSRVEFITRSGKPAQPYSFMRFCDSLHIGNYQFVQEEAGELRLIVEPGAGLPDRVEEILTQRASAHVGEPFRVRIDRSGQFALTEHGKKNPAVQRMAAAPERRAAVGS